LFVSETARKLTCRLMPPGEVTCQRNRTNDVKRKLSSKLGQLWRSRQWRMASNTQIWRLFVIKVYYTSFGTSVFIYHIIIHFNICCYYLSIAFIFHTCDRLRNVCSASIYSIVWLYHEQRLFLVSFGTIDDVSAVRFSSLRSILCSLYDKSLESSFPCFSHFLLRQYDTHCCYIKEIY
jgi:hypothetical protein